MKRFVILGACGIAGVLAVLVWARLFARDEPASNPPASLSKGLAVAKDVAQQQSLPPPRRGDAGVSARLPFTPRTTVTAVSQSSLVVSNLLNDCTYHVPLEQIPALTEGEIQRLLQHYRSLPSLKERWETARILAHQGNAQVLDALMYTLTEEFGERSFLDPEEGSRLLTMPALVGILAHRLDSAYDILIKGLATDYWRQRVHWKVFGESPYERLVSQCIEALANSGRDAGWRTLLKLRETADRSFLQQHSSAFVDAAYFHSLFEEGGWAFAMTNDSWERFVSWSETSDGRAWRNWAELQSAGSP